MVTIYSCSRDHQGCTSKWYSKFPISLPLICKINSILDLRNADTREFFECLPKHMIGGGEWVEVSTGKLGLEEVEDGYELNHDPENITKIIKLLSGDNAWSRFLEQQARSTFAHKVAFLDEEGMDRRKRASADGPAQVVSTTLVGLAVALMVVLCLVHGQAVMAMASGQ